MSYPFTRRYSVSQECGTFRVTTTSATTAGTPVFCNDAGTATGTIDYPLWTRWRDQDQDVVYGGPVVVETYNEERELRATRNLVAQREAQLARDIRYQHPRPRACSRTRRRDATRPGYVVSMLEQRRQAGLDYERHNKYEIMIWGGDLDKQYGRAIYTPRLSTLDNYDSRDDDPRYEKIPIMRAIQVRVRPRTRWADGEFHDRPSDFQTKMIESGEFDYKLKIRPLTNAEIKARRTARLIEVKRVQAHRDREVKSLILLKSWLSPNEYRDLMDDGILKIETGDEIYHICKVPSQTVYCEKKDGTRVGDFCLVHSSGQFAIGDILLTKVMMIKTDPLNFKTISVDQN